MPTINRLQPLKREAESQKNENTDARILRKELYNNQKWRKCRETHLKSQPLCQECLKKGIVNAGSLESPLQVHHIKSPFQNGKIIWELAYDDSNLETICAECHGKLHAGVEQTTEEIITNLDNLLNEYSTDTE